MDEYLFENGCHLPQGLAYVAEDLHLLEPRSPVLREATAFLNVAVRHALLTCSAIAGAKFEPEWVAGMMRQGVPYWRKTVKHVLEDALFGPIREDELPAIESGFPRSFPPGANKSLVDPAVVRHPAVRLPGDGPGVEIVNVPPLTGAPLAVIA